MGGPTIKRHAVEDWDAMILYARGKRSSIRRPCGRTMQVDRIGDNVRVPPVGLHHVQECLPVLSNREGDRTSIGSDCRRAEDLSLLAIPQFRADPTGELPDTFARSGRGNKKKIVRTESRRQSRVVRQGDL